MPNGLEQLATLPVRTMRCSGCRLRDARIKMRPLKPVATKGDCDLRVLLRTGAHVPAVLDPVRSAALPANDDVLSGDDADDIDADSDEDSEDDEQTAQAARRSGQATSFTPALRSEFPFMSSEIRTVNGVAVEFMFCTTCRTTHKTIKLARGSRSFRSQTIMQHLGTKPHKAALKALNHASDAQPVQLNDAPRFLNP